MPTDTNETAITSELARFENTPLIISQEQKHAMVINEQGYKVEFVLVDHITYDNGTTSIRPQSYVLNLGESLIYDAIPSALPMLKPRWNGSAWEETATPEEIAEAHPPLKPLPPTQPTERELTLMDAAAELYEQNVILREKTDRLEQRQIDAMLAITELFETAVEAQ